MAYAMKPAKQGLEEPQEKGNLIVPHPRHEGLFVGNGNTLYTKNLVPGVALDENDILIRVQNDDGTQVEYREWNPCKSKLAAAIVCGAHNIWIKPGSSVLYLGDVCETTVSHISDLVGPEGLVRVIEFNNWQAIENMAEKRLNILPIMDTPSSPYRYRMLVPDMVDVIVATVASDDQVRYTALNTQYFLKAGGHYMVYVKANSVDPTSVVEPVFRCLGQYHCREFKPMEQVFLEPFERDHAYVIGGFRVFEA